MKTKDHSRKMGRSDRRRSMRFAYVSSILNIVGAIGITPGVMSLVALKLGADEFYLGVLALAMLLPLAFSFLTLTTVERKGKRHVLFYWNAISTAFMLGFILIPLLVGHLSVNLLLGMILVIMLLTRATAAMGGTGWFPILQDAVPRRVNGKFFSNLRTAWQTAALVMALFVAWFLGSDTPWWKFQAIFIFSFVLLALRTISYLFMVEIPPRETSGPRSTMMSLLGDFLKTKPTARSSLTCLPTPLPLAFANPLRSSYSKTSATAKGLSCSLCRWSISVPSSRYAFGARSPIATATGPFSASPTWP